ncbi:polysaccharide deacetylase family protein [Streptomyces sp. TRM43335]|uniref:Polysaccharide deacetylase family protein n=1 Tax=Streptomyces taklimakanensis TaxID=2569853 RepID=A0A6G2BHG3_9ACTN|nr:polysaccharide deacetylase family protein [Streptomyces taklimakanensis]MTE21509.1 polysaccharide deacetylase family protein [Streptomyces taklimakanensis]
MTVSVRRTPLSLTALTLVTAAVAGCGGPVGDTPRAASPAAASPTGSASASPGPSASGAPDAEGAVSEYAVLPTSNGGRVAVFRHGPRPEDSEADRDEAEKREKPEEREKNDDEGDKVVALTFDAALSPEDPEGSKKAAEEGGEQTEKATAREESEKKPKEKGERHDNPGLLNTLRREKVPATVFMSGGWARAHRERASDIGRDRLFEVGTLSDSYRPFTPDCAGLEDLPVLAPGKQLGDVRKGLEALREAGVENPTPYFRFPGGCFDDRARKTVAPAGVTAVAGDVVAADAGASDEKKVADRVLSQVEPGSVVVLHWNRAKAPVTEKVVDRIVPKLRERGYRFVRVSEMIAAAVGRG